MKKLEKSRINRLLPALCLLLALAALLCLWQTCRLGRSLDSQLAAERWQGESETRFAQISCFVSVDHALSREEIYAFRGTMLNQLKEAEPDEAARSGGWHDAWCAMGGVTASGERGSAEAAVIAVGGGFFDFHPLRLLSGSYLREDDLTLDRVLLDEELAWRLFGGTELAGMELQLNGQRFSIAGVVEREKDAASRAAYTDGPGLYMSYEAYEALTGSGGVCCYELLLPEPVQGWALSLAREKFPLGGGEAIQNSERFGLPRLLALRGSMDARTMQSRGLRYPYWENAARLVENRCLRLLTAALLLGLLPLCALLFWLFLLLRRLWRSARDSYLPRGKDKAAEAIRRAQRRRWEKRHFRHAPSDASSDAKSEGEL